MNDLKRVEVLRRAADRIRAKPGGYDQSTYASKDSSAPCGTVCCMAGEIVIASVEDEKRGLAKLWRMVRRGKSPGMAADRYAPGAYYADYFGATARDWPFQFNQRYYAAATQRGRAGAAAAFLDWMADRIEKGKEVVA